MTLAWYDFRDDGEYFLYTPISGDPGQYSFTLEPDGNLFGNLISAPPFTLQVVDPSPGTNGVYRTLRHTVDVRAAQALSGLPPTFGSSVLVSQYDYGSPTGPVGQDEPVEQLDFDAPNLPMFESGTVPFVGDYIDVAGPTFIPTGRTWRYNNLTTDPDYTHVVWTDNRNVIPPPSGYTWADYQPPGTTAGQTSVFNGSALSGCSNPNLTGMRNQDIYTATLSPGIILAIPGNTKPLATTLQRQFAVNLENTTTQTLSFQLAIESQPTGGTASFVQFPATGQGPTTTVQVTVPGLSSASRSVFVTSSSPTASVVITAEQLTGPGGSVVSGGLTSTATINPDASNPTNTDPNITTEEVYNPNIANPNIANPNIANPNIANPNIANPNIANPNIANPNIANPNIANPNIANPNIANPNIANPNIANPNIANTSLSDVDYTITNTGNTTASYSVQVLANQQIPSGIAVQLIVSGVYTTPYASGCTLSTTAHFVPLLNETNPTVLTSPSQIPTGTPTPSTPTVTLAPGATALVTLRIAVPNSLAATYNSQTLLNLFTPVVVSNAANTGSTTPPKTLAILTPSLNQATVGALFSQTLQAYGGTGSGYKWSFVGTAPSFLTIGSTTGTLSGTPTSPSTSSFTVQVNDSGGNTATKTFSLVVNGAPAIAFTALSPREQGVVYSEQLAATGGTPPLVWSSSSLPPGLILSTAGLLSGSTIAGNYTPTITVTDANQVTTSKQLSLSIAAPLSVPGNVMISGEQGAPLSTTLTATGGVAPLVWTLTPAISGLTYTSAGTISGTPTTSGTFPLGVKVADTLGATASETVTINLAPAPTVQSLPATLLSPTNPTYNTAISPTQISGSSGSGTYTSYSSSSLPPGLTISPSGVISGTPTQTGIFNNVYISVTDSSGSTGTGGPFSINVGPQVTTGPSTGFVNNTYPATILQATDGNQNDTYTWSGSAGTGDASGTGGALGIAGMYLDASGILTGYPTASGNDTITVTDVTTGGTTTVSYLINGSTITRDGSVRPEVLSNISITGASTGTLQVVTTPGGTSVTLNFTYSLVEGNAYCPGCIDQLTVGFVGQGAAQVCVYFGEPGPGGTSGSASATLNIPTTPGRYYIGIHRDLQYTCGAAVADGISASDAVVAAVDVIPTTYTQIPNFTISGGNINNTGSNFALITKETVPVLYPQFPSTLNYSVGASNQSQALIISLNTDSQAQVCIYSSGSASGGFSSIPGYPTLTVSYLPGTTTTRPSRYYISVEGGAYTCSSTGPLSWFIGVPGNDFTKVVGAIDVTNQ